MQETLSELSPIVLNPTTIKTPDQTKKNIGWKARLGMMALGWLLGNIVIGGIIGLFLIFTIASSGLIRIPLLSAFLFQPTHPTTIDQAYLASASKKIEEVASLKTGDSLPKVTFSQEEIDAYLADSFQKNSASIINPTLEISSGKFVFSGNLKDTGAPIKVTGSINTDNGVLKIDLTKGVFGKLSLPSVLTSSILDQSLSKIGFSLEGNPLPARKLTVQDGSVTLEEVSPGQ